MDLIAFNCASQLVLILTFLLKKYACRSLDCVRTDVIGHTLAPFDPNDDETTPLRHHPKTRHLVCHWTILLSGIDPFETVAH